MFRSGRVTCIGVEVILVREMGVGWVGVGLGPGPGGRGLWVWGQERGSGGGREGKGRENSTGCSSRPSAANKETLHDRVFMLPLNSGEYWDAGDARDAAGTYNGLSVLPIERGP